MGSTTWPPLPAVPAPGGKSQTGTKSGAVPSATRTTDTAAISGGTTTPTAKTPTAKADAADTPAAKAPEKFTGAGTTSAGQPDSNGRVLPWSPS